MDTMRIHVVGRGCTRCEQIEKNVIEACDQMKLQASISHVEQLRNGPSLGAWFIPAVVVNGRVVAVGKVPTVAELKRIFTD